jgi:UDP-N-acetylglucosamine--N-acetylmuramyl-(pentapeptide) pyrophosphoryl-undecaprenol N-acetylglucosamine transferase
VTRYLLAGGGTAGHVNPLLAVADRIRDREPDAVILVLGTAQGLESRLVPARGYELLVVDRLPFPRAVSASVARFPGRFRAIVRSVRQLITEHAIDVVVGFGGYVSAPAYLAARAEKVPIVIHEANAKPGMANRLGSVMTGHVGVAFAGTRLPRARLVGMPLRREIEHLDRHATRREAIYAAAASILGTGWQILHITGEKSDLPASELPGYVMVRYCDRMELALSAADLVLSRAGAATVSELMGLGLPAVYVPLAIGNGEQRRNAQSQVAAGGALVVENSDFTPEWVSTQLVPLLLNRPQIADMAARTSAVGTRDGADRTVDLIQDALRGTRKQH